MSKVVDSVEARKTPGKRRYNSTRRAEQAAETRRRIVTAAAECFAERGYARTTLAQIAERAEVSVESVAANGPKRALILAAFEQSLAGDEGQQGTVERDVAAPILALEDPDEFLQAAAEFAVTSASRAIGIWRAFSSAADDDEELAAVYRALAGRRREDARALARILHSRGWLRTDATVEQHADTLALLTGLDPYQLYVREFGWTEDELRAWFVDTARRLLFA